MFKNIYKTKSQTYFPLPTSQNSSVVRNTLNQVENRKTLPAEKIRDDNDSSSKIETLKA